MTGKPEYKVVQGQRIKSDQRLSKKNLAKCFKNIKIQTYN